MPARPSKPADLPWLMPYLTVRDPDAALDFYVKAFGFEKRFAMPGPDGKTMHAEVRYRDAVVMFGPECPQNPSQAPVTSGTPCPVGLYIYCDDVDAIYARALAAGAKSERPPADQFYGDRTCTVSDPDGHQWSFGKNIADFDPSNMPKG